MDHTNQSKNVQNLIRISPFFFTTFYGGNNFGQFAHCVRAELRTTALPEQQTHGTRTDKKKTRHIEEKCPKCVL